MFRLKIKIACQGKYWFSTFPKKDMGFSNKKKKIRRWKKNCSDVDDIFLLTRSDDSKEKNLYKNDSKEILTESEPILRGGSDILNVEKPYADPLPLFSPLKKLIIYFFFNLSEVLVGWKQNLGKQKNLKIGNLLCIHFGSFQVFWELLK